MAKILGVVGLVVAILGIFVPMVALFVMWIALAIATCGALFGDRVFAVITWVITTINLLFLSPMAVAMLLGEQAQTQDSQGNALLLFITVIVFVAPLLAIALNATGKVVLNEAKTSSYGPSKGR